MKLLDVIQELVDEKGLEQSALSDVVAEGMLAAYQKKYPELSLRVNVDSKTGTVTVEVEKKIVTRVSDPQLEVSTQKIRALGLKSSVGDMAWVEFDGTIGRVEVLRARQVIANKIRSIEAKIVHDEYKPKEGEIVMGTVHKCERGGTVVSIDDVLAFLPKSLSIPGEKCIAGFTVRALLKEVLLEPRGDNQLVLDRISSEFLQRLFELEIPEVFERIVEIKEIVRSPGYRSKVVVSSRDRNIDPVGTCVGVGGSRIKPILRELSGEKIDIIGWSESLEVFVKNALKPAVVDSVEMSDDNAQAVVVLASDQRALAIGKGGQNITLASKLTGVKIQLEKEN